MNSWELFILYRNVTGERGTRLLETPPPAPSWSEGHTRRRTMEVLGENENHFFLMKHCFLRGCSTSEPGGSKSAKLSEESCKPTLLSPCTLMTRPPRPAEQQFCSTAMWQAKSKLSGADTVSMPWLLQCLGQTQFKGRAHSFSVSPWLLWSVLTRRHRKM